MTAQPDRVHVHSDGPNLAPGAAQKGKNGQDPARRPARARVISHLHLVDQGYGQEDAAPHLGASLLAEMAEQTAAATADSDLARQHMTPAEAFELILPERGESRRNPIVWTAMTYAGLARFVIVSLGHLVAVGGQTRIRAGILATVVLLALAGSWIAGHLS
jgi:hypothetical protein